MKINLTKRLIAFFLTVLMAFTSVPVSVFAQELDDLENIISQAPIQEADEEASLTSFDGTGVASSEALEQALSTDAAKICITADFELDRTFYITRDVTIYSVEKHTLTRKADFAGDIFVIGEAADGTVCQEKVTLTIGTPDTKNSDMLIIDGNKTNMTVTVTGTVFFVCKNGQADLHPDLTVTNCEKQGNVRALDSKHTLNSDREVIGGAVAIVVENHKDDPSTISDGVMNIYGGKYLDNGVASSGGYGGAFFNHGVINVYDGVFKGGYATRAGAFYNYRRMNIYKAEISDNTASSMGGAIYLPASSAADLYIGGDSKTDDAQVVFKNNSSKTAGAISASGTLVIRNTRFEGNNATAGGGAVYGTGSYCSVDVYDSSFTGNTAGTTGGAISLTSPVNITVTDSAFDNNLSTEAGGAVYTLGSAADFKNVSFNGNRAGTNGGALYLPKSVKATVTGSDFTKNSSTASGGAVYALGATAEFNDVSFTENSAGGSGGVIYMNKDTESTVDENGESITVDVPSSVSMVKVTATKNSAVSNGGVIYSGKANLVMYNSTIKENTAKAGSAFYFSASAEGEIYNTVIEKNACLETNTSNAGALFVYTGGTKITLHSCTIKDNTSNGLGGGIFASSRSLIDLYNIKATGNKAAKGGFIYITTTDTHIKAVGLTVADNTASSGPILFSNSAGAKFSINKALYIDEKVTPGTELDDAYWASALYYPSGKGLKVEAINDEIPPYAEPGNESAGDMTDATDVSSADELAAALAAGKAHIRIINDFKLDRTFTVNKNTVIFSTKAHTLKRDENFGGIIFNVVPESADKTVTFTLGNKISETENLLVIDGNKDEMKVEVTGAVINVQQGAKAELYKNITFTFNSVTPVSVKGEITVNDGTFTDNTAAVIYNEGNAEIKGGSFKSNTSAANGGAIYNKSTLNITGGTFTSNTAVNGGAIYNEGTLNINGATFTSNKATGNGGAIHSFSVTDENVTLELVSVTFSKNSASKGGAISAEKTNLTVNAQFQSNSATNGGSVYLFAGCNADFSGAKVISSSSKETAGFLYSVGSAVSFIDCSIESSSSVKTGGALYISKGSTLDVLTSEFRNNKSQTSGGAVYLTADSASARFDTVEFSGNTAMDGGAVYNNTDNQLEIINSSFTSCSAVSGGAIYSCNGNIMLDTVTFNSNAAQDNGGAAILKGATKGTLNNIIAENNAAGKSGAAFFIEDAQLTLTDSEFKNNAAEKNGGAISAQGDTVLNSINTVFESNTANKNGGAVNIATDGTALEFSGCTFLSNTSAENGGAFYVGAGSIVGLYNNTVSGNKANNGAVLYITGRYSEVTVSSMTVSGNESAANGIIHGASSKAILKLDKTSYADLDEQGTLDDAYWTKTITGIVSLEKAEAPAPDYSKNAVKVSTAKELENAINKNYKNIHIIADFAIDRTYFIKSDVTIYSTEPHTLTRATEFGGDFFVVGETSNGTRAYFDNKNVRLTVGHPDSKTENLLVIDGNMDNMKKEVYGSIFFVSYGAHVDLYDNLTVKNCYKQNNERSYNELYKLSRPNRIGGSVAIIANGMLTVHGGNYINNRVNDEDSSSEEGRNSSIGGVFYNKSNLIIRNGNFEGNQAARGGIVYNYCIVRIVAGTFRKNVATLYSAIYYSPSSAGIHFLMGNTDKDGEKLLFKSNISKYGGSVATSSHFSAVACIGNTSFKNNTVTSGNGGVISTTSMLTVKNAEFIGNTAKNYGGAIYFNRSDNDEITRLGNIEGCVFDGNKAQYGGAVATYSSAVKNYGKGSICTVKDCVFTDNVSTSSGGAIYSDCLSKVKIENNIFENNKSVGEAGAIYTIGKSNLTLKDNSFIDNSALSHGGAITIRSSTLSSTGDTFSNNTAKSNGGAIYHSYSSAQDINSHLTLDGTKFIGNSGSSGGAIYATRRAIEENAVLINAKNTVFEQNRANSSAGAVLLTAGIKTYFYNTTFSNNTAKAKGGAVSVGSNTLFEAEKAAFTGNTASESGGALSLSGAGTAVMSDVTATGNKSSVNGGFAYNEGATLKLYNSRINNNIADAGSAMYFYTSAEGGIYNTVIDGNICDEGTTGNAGAVFVYTGGTKVTLNGCTISNNASSGLGGGILVSGNSKLDLYNITATGNSAAKGGFMYETTSGTVVEAVGLTVSGNTASVGGPVIWGNTKNATLNIDKSKYKDNDNDVAQDGYWDSAIVNLLKVNDVSKDIAAAEKYVSKQQPEKPAETKKPVSVEDVFTLAKKSSDADINSNYNKLKKLDNSRNFMSRSTKDYKNINGKTVTVDTFVYPTKGKTDNGIVGLGILLYQSLLYKKANPKEEMYIDISSYRFSVQSAVNINRNSRYFGYMRDLVGVNYDKYGFVRLSYLLITAAKMGIHVNVIGQLDAYPISKSNPNFYEYFTQQLSDPCDPKYANGKVIGDYLDFNFCYWTLDAKGGTDMMHTKMAAVSHYLDMNGVAHRNAIWSSSSNLDGVKADGQNANWKLQTALLITNHDDLYRVTVNYLRLISSLCGQEEVIEFQDIVNRRSTEQIDLINKGRAKEIPANEQLVYLGSAKDDVFELYFTPFGGSHVAWDEVHNPYCKYLREMYDSEDYIIFAYNAAEYSGKFTLGQQIEGMIIGAFHKNKNVKNKIYSYMESFDPTTFDDLVVGKDIGYKSFFERPFGKVHNKDMQLSYVKNGKRQFVTLHNSLNFHSGSMSYQSNFMIVVKDKSCAEDTVFSTIARYSTTGGIADHTYSAEKTKAATSKKDGYTYKECIYCGDTIITGKVHYASSKWVVDKKATTTENGVRHKSCKHCGDIVLTEEIARLSGNVNVSSLKGKSFTSSTSSLIKVNSTSAPLTIEAKIRVPRSQSARAGTIVGNYGVKSGDVINLEVYENGKLKLYIKKSSKTFTYTFKKDIRSDEAVDIAVVMSSGKAVLYVNGEKTETAKVKVSLPKTVSELKIGGDNRSKNTNYFKGKLYYVHLYSDARTSSELKKDRLYVSPEASSIIYSSYYNDASSDVSTTGLDSMKFSAKKLNKLNKALSSTPKTIEATIQLSKSVKGEGGVIFGNYNKSYSAPFNLEIYTKGRVRLYFKNGKKTVSHVFKTDIRSDSAVNIAVTISGKTAVLYVNGAKKETAKLKASLPSVTKNFCVGGDNRSKNSNYFKGKLYSLHVFSDVRSASEIRNDMIAVASDADKLMYSAYVTSTSGQKAVLKGQTFSKSVRYALPTYKKTPHTIEATVQLSESVKKEAGVIVGSYDGKSGNYLNLSVAEKGKLKLSFKNGKTTVSKTFKYDIRTKSAPVNIAVTIKDKTATLYINGVKKEAVKLSKTLGSVTKRFAIGGDMRSDNSKYFKGKIYSVNLFSDVRTASEIKSDAKVVTKNAGSLLFTGIFYTNKCNIKATGKSHSASSWKTVYSATKSECGVSRTTCTACGKTLEVKEIKKKTVKLNSVSYASKKGKSFTKNSDAVAVKNSVNGKAFTAEAMVQLSTDFKDRAGTILGNYDGGKSDQFNLEVYTNGKLRLYYKVNSKAYTHNFSTDIRSAKKTHIAITVEGKTVKLYINGKYKESCKLKVELPSAIKNLKVGADNRSGETNCFNGRIYSAHIFNYLRSANQIQKDRYVVSNISNFAVYSSYYG